MIDNDDDNAESAAENWLEVLGSGLVHSKIISKTATPDAKGFVIL